MIENGRPVILVDPNGKHYMRTMDERTTLHTQDGVLKLSDVAKAGYGGEAATHMGRIFRILRPTVYDLIKAVKRSTQIIYPKETGYIILKLGIGPGTRVIEAGSGSGGLTLALAWYVGDTGRVYTFERRPEFYKLCGENLACAGLGHRVVQFNRDIAEGFVPQPDDPDFRLESPDKAEALFLDVRTPWDYLEQAAAAMEPGAPAGFLLPTMNQVEELLRGLEKAPFEDVEIMELLLRRYKPVADRLRPEDRMVAHTGYLVFARRQGVGAQNQAPEAPKGPAVLGLEGDFA